MTTFFTCEDNYQSVLTIKVILRCYELALGSKINFHKSKLAGLNIERNTFECYAKILNCTQISIPFKYLGMVVGVNLRKGQYKEPILTKLRTRLSASKGRLLSLARRICLIKSVFRTLLFILL